jgi:inner membrane protein YidH
LHGQTEPGNAMIAVPPSSSPIADPRVYLAAERTFLAWIRTSVSLMGFGFLIARFALFLREYGMETGLEPRARPAISSWLGFGMVCVGVFVCVMAAVRHQAYIQALEHGVGNPPLSVRTALIVAAVLALVGLALAIHIMML